MGVGGGAFSWRAHKPARDRLFRVRSLLEPPAVEETRRSTESPRPGSPRRKAPAHAPSGIGRPAPASESAAFVGPLPWKPIEDWTPRLAEAGRSVRDDDADVIAAVCLLTF